MEITKNDMTGREDLLDFLAAIRAWGRYELRPELVGKEMRIGNKYAHFILESEECQKIISKFDPIDYLIIPGRRIGELRRQLPKKWFGIFEVDEKDILEEVIMPVYDILVHKSFHFLEYPFCSADMKPFFFR